MLLKIIYLFVVIQGISCAFPKYIERCPKSDPNAKKCVLQNARKGFAVLIHGSKELNLESFTPFVISNTKLSVGDDSEIVINGYLIPSNDTQIIQARVDLQQKYWYIVYSSKLVSLNLNFTITVKETKNNAIIAKGRMLNNLINLYSEYTGYYDTITIDNVKYMQITHSKAELGYEKYTQKILELTTTDNKKLNESDQKEVLKKLNNLEPTIKQYVDTISQVGTTYTFNTILKTESEDNVFIN